MNKQSHFQSLSAFSKNRKGDITITILVVEVLLLCAFALATFVSSDIQVRNSFIGIGQVQKLNSQIEQNSFYGNVLSEEGLSENGDLYSVISSYKKTKLVSRTCACEDSCKSYADFILQSSSKYDVDPFVMLSLMMQESDCVSKAFSGSSVGLMQINLIHCGKYGLLEDKDKCKEQLMSNIQLNIEVGAKILREGYNTWKDGRVFNGCSNRNITYTGWEAALRSYNGWEIKFILKILMLKKLLKERIC